MGEISSLGFKDIPVGAAIFDMLKVDRAAMTDSHQFSKLQDIAKYASGLVDPVFEFRTAMSKYQGADPLSHLWSYIQLKSRKSEVEMRKHEVESKVVRREWKDEKEKQVMEKAFEAVREEQKNVDLEIDFYKS